MPSRYWESHSGKKTKKWRARVKYRYIEYYLGTFDTKEEAKKVEEAWWAKKGYVNGKRPWANRVARG